ncbi:MAG: GntR family transcriptional regulator [Lachnospiraceae bacterium]|nr:GntR family transcriptional regulator [Lachnospiraceae bacterium]
MNNDNLYEYVISQIYDAIFQGKYSDGDRIPAERELAESLGVSRVTVRKSLELLEQDGLIMREVGRGTTLRFHKNGNEGTTDMIVLIAPAKNVFFANFIAALQNYAETKNSLILYVEKPKSEKLEQCLYKLYKRGLRNAVIWLEDLLPDQDKLQRLRAIGMNMVFFDSDKGMPYADCVTLDNRRAIKALYQYLKEQGKNNIGYIGWDNETVYSVSEREHAFEAEAHPGGRVLHLPWKQREKSVQILDEYLKNEQADTTDGILCGDREIGEMFQQIMEKNNKKTVAATVDITYGQNLEETVKQIFGCLERQCGGKETWNAELYKITGVLLGK